MTNDNVLDAVPAGKTPYTPEEIAEFQRAYDAGDWSGLVSIVDPYRMQASVEAASLRGMEFERECVAKDKKEIWKLVAVLAVTFLSLWGCLAFLDAIRLSPNPSTVPHISSE